MKLLIIAALAQLAHSGHVAVRMPYLNPANVAYQVGSLDYSSPLAYSHNQYGYAEAPVYGDQLAYAKTAAVGIAQVPVKAAVAVPTVHHVPAAVDVPYTKYEAQPAVVQKVVDVAKPAVKTRKYEVRRPAIQKQFYDIEERTIVRPVGSALVELDEPLSKAQKGPAVVTSADGQQSIEEHGYEIPVAHHEHHAVPVSYHAAPAHTVAITPAPHIAVTTAAPYVHHEAAVAITPVPYKHIESPYLHKQLHNHVVVSTTPAPVHFAAPEQVVVTSTPLPHYADDAVVVDSAAKYAAAEFEARFAHEQALAQAHYTEQALAHAHHAKQAHLAVETISNGSPIHVAKIAPEVHAPVHQLGHLSSEEAQNNQQKLIKLLTAKGGVAEVGFERNGYAEHVGDAGITRARVLSATPSPHHHPVDEKVKTRRIVVSRPVQTLQEIDVVEPVTKVERIAVNQPTVIKTAKVGVERVHTSVPVYGKAYAPAIAHAEVPVQYYH